MQQCCFIVKQKCCFIFEEFTEQILCDLGFPTKVEDMLPPQAQNFENQPLLVAPSFALHS